MSSVSSLAVSDIDQLDWSKAGGLMPAVIQDARNEAVLMLGVPAWTFVPFVFQAPIVVIAMRMSGMSARGLSGFMLGYALLAAAILIPLYVLWMQAIGTFGTIIR